MRRYDFWPALLVVVIAGCSLLGPRVGSEEPATSGDQVQYRASNGKLTTLHSFAGEPDGAEPQAPMTARSTCTDHCSVSLLGTTASGGANNAGAIYRLYNADVTNGGFGESVVMSYTPSITGSDPTGSAFDSLHQGLFATASQGGANGKGTVINGNQPFVLSFDGHNGATPISGVSGIGTHAYDVTTYAGGNHDQGAILAIRLSEKEQKITPQLLYSFSGNGDGAHPNTQVVEWGDYCNPDCSPLFGTTAGSKKTPATVYEFSHSQGLTTLYTFKNSEDGVTPNGIVVMHADSSPTVTAYGTTLKGGSSGYGTLYELEPNGSQYTEVTLHSFSGGSADGAYPQGPPTVYNGTLYIATTRGGKKNCGTISAYDPPSKNSVVVYSFKCGSDGAYPKASLIVGPYTHSLFGTTSAGGSAHHGTAFSFEPPKER